MSYEDILKTNETNKTLEKNKKYFENYFMISKELIKRN